MIYMAQGRDERRNLLETLVKFWFPQKAAIFWLSERQSASEVGTGSMESVAHHLVQYAREMTNGL